MAVLLNGDLVKVYAEFVAEFNISGETITITKAELKAAVVAIDGWLDTNAAALNSAIPQPARANLTVRQKARLLRCVVRRRYEVS